MGHNFFPTSQSFPFYAVPDAQSSTEIELSLEDAINPIDSHHKHVHVQTIFHQAKMKTLSAGHVGEETIYVHLQLVKASIREDLVRVDVFQILHEQ